MMLNSVVNVWVEYRASRVWPRDPVTGMVRHPVVLPDLGFQFLPYFPNDVFGFSLADVSMNVVILIAILRAFIGSKPGHPFIVLKRVLLLSSVSYLGRAMSVPMTMLPSPDMRCVPRLVDGSMFWSVMLMPFGLSHTCADVFYSGHSIPITLSMMFWMDYTASVQERVFGSLLSVMALLIIVCTHFHYTLDVFYGVGLTVIIWRLYHFGLTVPAVVLNSNFYMFWEADSFIEDGDDQDASESSVTPCSVPTQTTSESYHDILLIDVRKGHKPVHVQLASPAETVSWKLYDEPRIVWGTVACSSDDLEQQQQHAHQGYKPL